MQPLPVRWRCCSAARMPKAASVAACWSTIAEPTGVGAAPPSPDSIAMPLIACSSKSCPGRFWYGPEEP